MLSTIINIKKYQWIENYYYFILNYNIIIEKILNYLYNNYHIILIIYFLLLYFILICLLCSNEINIKTNSNNKKITIEEDLINKNINILSVLTEEYKNNINELNNKYDIILIKNKEYFLINNIIYKINKIKGDIYGVYNEDSNKIIKLKK